MLRLLVSALLAMVFIAAFVAFFVLGSLLSYVDEPAQVIDSARDYGLRDKVVDLASRYIGDDMRQDPALESISDAELHGIVDSVITQDWLEESLTTGHAAVKDALHGAESSAVLDLRATKAALAQALQGLGTRAEADCAEVFGAEACGDAEHARAMVRSYEVRGAAAINAISDDVNLLSNLHGRDRDKAERMQKGLESLQTVRMLALVVLIISLALLLALNARPWRRMFVTLGIVSLSASVIYLLAIRVSAGLAGDALTKEAGQRAADPIGEFTTGFIGRVLDDCFSGSTLPVVMVGIGGLIFLVLSRLLPRS